MSFRVLQHYPRRSHLEFFRSNPNPFYGVNFELDATAVRAARARASGASTYAALVWAYHRALLPIDAFRTRLRGEDVVLYDTLRIGMTVPAPDRTFTFAPLEWEPSAESFLARAAEAVARAERVDLTGGADPDFAYYTALPKVPFTSFTHVALPDPRQGQPEAAFGRFREQDGRTIVPVGVAVNHLYVDGADLGELYEGLADSFARAF